MKRHVFPITTVTLTTLLGCFAAFAQAQHGPTPGDRPIEDHAADRETSRTPPRIAAIARPAATGAADAQRSSQASTHQFAANDNRQAQTASLVNTVPSNDVSGVPGLGFDYVHLAAISGSSMNGRAARFDLAGRRTGSAFTPIFFSTWPYLSDAFDPAYRPVEQPQPQIIVIQQPAPVVEVQQAAAASSARDSISPDAVASAPVPLLPVEPARDVDEFVLVRTDGRLFFASAFSVVGSQLRYVTTEGIRRTLPIAELDKEATRAMNEARGTEIHLPN